MYIQMSVIDTIMSALRSLAGGGSETSDGAPDPDTRREGQVSVEHDPGAERTAVGTSTEAAVKEPDSDSTTDAGSDDEGDDAVAVGTDAAASTGTLVDEDTGREPAETVGDAGGVDVDRTVNEDAVGGDEAADETRAGDGEADDPADGTRGDIDASDDGADSDAADGNDTDESVEVIKGIGPAYAERLGTVGIETVGELAAADAAEVAAGIDVPESRVGSWIERANDAS